jgi:hypothetical protein
MVISSSTSRAIVRSNEVRTHYATDPDADRVQQKELLVALNAWTRALRRDECGAWCIRGTSGSVHTWGDGATWVLYVACRSKRHWSATKLRLVFCIVTQDGSTEGCLRLLQLPTSEQAAVIRDVLGIRKRTEFTPEDLERRRASMSRASPALGSANRSATVRDPILVQAPISPSERGISS